MMSKLELKNSIPRRRNSGFTFLEVLIAIGLLALLASLIFARMSSARQRSHFAAGQTQWKSITHAMLPTSEVHWDLNEGSGLIVANKGPNASLVGNIIGGTWQQTGGPTGGTYLDFTSNSGDDLVVSDAVMVPKNVTIAAWIKTSSTGPQTIFSNRTLNGKVQFGTLNGRLKVDVGEFVAPESPILLSNKFVSDDLWHYVVWTSDGLRSAFYIDGAFDSSQAQTRNQSQGTGYIGRDPQDGSFFFGGIAQLGVYAQTLDGRP